jgi:hypothetical protein
VNVAAHVAGAAFVNSLDRQTVAKGSNDLRLQSFGSGGQALQHRDAAVHVGDDARKAIPLAVQKTEAIRLLRHNHLAQGRGRCHATTDQLVVDRKVLPCQQANGNGAARIGVATADEAAVGGEDGNDAPRGEILGHRRDGPGEDPRVPETRGALPVRL